MYRWDKQYPRPDIGTGHCQGSELWLCAVIERLRALSMELRVTEKACITRVKMSCPFCLVPFTFLPQPAGYFPCSRSKDKCCNLLKPCKSDRINKGFEVPLDPISQVWFVQLSNRTDGSYLGSTVNNRVCLVLSLRWKGVFLVPCYGNYFPDAKDMAVPPLQLATAGGDGCGRRRDDKNIRNMTPAL